MRLRSSQTLVFSLQAQGIAAFNYLTNSTFECDPDLLGLLSSLDAWSELEKVAALVPAIPPKELEETLQSLVEVNALVEEGSALAGKEDELSREWKWGVPAALFHFSVQNRHHMSLEETEELQRERIADRPQPPLYLRHDGAGSDCIKLPPVLHSSELMELMAKRRTIRSALPVPVTLTQLAECLFAGMGITGRTSNCVGELPLSMTPSGGARNPYEAYVYARSIAGLDPGVYHYSAADHSLARQRTNDLPLPSALLGGQAWVDEMACVIILSAFLERSMWKYDDANAYRVVLIEAGHIGQNIMLAATRHGLSACPTAALNHEAVQRVLGTGNQATRSPVYALTLAYPGTTQ